MLWDAEEEHLGIVQDLWDISGKDQRQGKGGTKMICGGKGTVKYGGKGTEGTSCTSIGCWAAYSSGHALDLMDTFCPVIPLNSTSHYFPG